MSFAYLLLLCVSSNLEYMLVHLGKSTDTQPHPVHTRALPRSLVLWEANMCEARLQTKYWKKKTVLYIWGPLYCEDGRSTLVRVRNLNSTARLPLQKNVLQGPKISALCLPLEWNKNIQGGSRWSSAFNLFIHLEFLRYLLSFLLVSLRVVII